MSNRSPYEALYRDLVASIEEMHRLNVKKTSAALKSLLIVPTVFLIMLFLTSSSKSIFLVLWIVSMFVIAGILIVIEYQDYKLQLMLAGIKDKEALLLPHTESAADSSTTAHSDAPAMQKAAQIRQSIFSRAPVEATPEEAPAEAEAAVPEEAGSTASQPEDCEAECSEESEAVQAESRAAEQPEEEDVNSEPITKQETATAYEEL